MGWVRIDDAFYDHPAHAGLELAAWGLWTWSLAWSNRNLSDGAIPKTVVKRMDPDGEATGALINSGRWLDNGEGVAVHDYLEWQPSKEQILSKRERERQRNRGRTAATPPGAAEELPCEEPQPQPLPNGKEKASRKTRISLPWVNTEEMLAWASTNCPAVDVHRETEKFVDDAKAHGRSYIDWVAAWKGWLRRNRDGAFR